MCRARDNTPPSDIIDPVAAPLSLPAGSMNLCTTQAGPDRCILPAAHDGDHRTYWGGGVVLVWHGDEPWSHTR